MQLKTLFLIMLSLIINPAIASPLNVDTTQTLYKQLVLDKVIDGDTFHSSGKKIRLWGIDAPEKDEAMYESSSITLDRFIKGSKLMCKLIEIDYYQRSVMHCFVNQSDLGGLMVQTGYAKDYPKYSRRFYNQEQKLARDAELGIWK